MSKILTSLLLFCIYGSLTAQVEWETIASVHFINEIETYDTKVYVCHRGGLLVIDKLTGAEINYMPSNSNLKGYGVTDIEFLSNGDAWVAGAEFGLYYFDGEHFTEDQIVRGEESPLVSNLRVYDDVLWYTLDFGTKFQSYDNGVIKEHSSIYPNGVNRFDIDEQGHLWIASTHMLRQYTGVNSLSLAQIPNGSSEGLFCDNQGRQWITNLDGQLNYLHSHFQTEWTSYEVPYRIQSIVDNKSGDVYFSSPGVISTIENDVFITDSLHLIYPNLPRPTDQVLSHIDDDGSLWFTIKHDTEGDQVYHLSNGQVKSYATNESFIATFTTSLVQDCDGDLYYSNSDFLQNYSSDEWTTIYPNYRTVYCNISRLELNPYTCDVWGISGYGGTSCHSLWKISDSTATEIEILPTICNSISFDEKGNTYVADGRRLFIIDSLGLIQNIEFFEDGRMNSRHVHYASDGALWVIWYDTNLGEENIYRSVDGVITQYNHNNTPLDFVIPYWSYEDQNGNMWFSSIEGLVKYDRSEWVMYPIELDPDQSLIITDMIEDNDGNYWISIWNQGLILLEGEEMTHFNIHNSNLQSDFCKELELFNNHLWVRHSYGFTKIKLYETSSTQTPPTARPDALPQFTLYPNPTHGPFKVKNKTATNRIYKVYNLNGEHILTETSDKEVWSATLDPGVYLIKVISAHSESAKKLVVTD